MLIVYYVCSKNGCLKVFFSFRLFHDPCLILQEIVADSFQLNKWKYLYVLLFRLMPCCRFPRHFTGNNSFTLEHLNDEPHMQQTYIHVFMRFSFMQV